ncbi:hypothetical protein PBCVAP110A_450R [Paramecium bursaria Chlorella virus AP110A]|nr:hypothetical protein PBCVAP110A_450R [Paramecium bursaria Chlorella virus AP110A]
MAYIQTYSRYNEDDAPMYISKTEHDIMLKMREFYEEHVGKKFLRNGATDDTEDCGYPSYCVSTLFDGKDQIMLTREHDELSFYIQTGGHYIEVTDGDIIVDECVLDWRKTVSEEDITDKVLSKFIQLTKTFPTKIVDTEQIMWLQSV